MSDQAAPEGRSARLPRGRWASLHARLSNEHLARAVARGRQDAFAEIYRRHHQELYRYCQSILRNGEEAEDALQSAMTKAFAALRAQERDLAVRPWLFRIAHNEAVTLLRRRRRQDLHVSQMAIEAVETLDLSPERTIEQRERMSTLLSDLAALAERQRAALLMRELSGLSIEEIAGALATTPGAAKQALFEARRALREFAEGRTMDCETVRCLIEEHDGRLLRSRLVRSHLRSCVSCSEVERSIAQRRLHLRALAPPLPAVVGGAILVRLLRHVAVPHGAAGIAVAAKSGSGAAGAAAGSGGAAGAGAGTAAAGVAGGATGGGLSAAVGGSVAAKVGLGAAIVAFAAVGAAHVATGSHKSFSPKVAGNVERHPQSLASRPATSVSGRRATIRAADEPHAGRGSSSNRVVGASTAVAGRHRPAGSTSSVSQGKAGRRGRKAPAARRARGAHRGGQGIVHQAAATAKRVHGGAQAHAGAPGARSKVHGHGLESSRSPTHRGITANGSEAKHQRSSKGNAKGQRSSPSSSAGATRDTTPGGSASHGSPQAPEGKAVQHGHDGSGQGTTSSESTSTSTTVLASHGHH